MNIDPTNPKYVNAPFESCNFDSQHGVYTVSDKPPGCCRRSGQKWKHLPSGLFYIWDGKQWWNAEENKPFTNA